MSYMLEDQCEDGELQQSPNDDNRFENILSDSGGETECKFDLEIRPPQAKPDQYFLKTKRLKSYHKSSKKQDDRHKEKHRDKYLKHSTRDYKHRGKETSRDKQKSEQVAYVNYLHEKASKERQRSSDQKRFDDTKEFRLDNERLKSQKYEERADKALRDLRERLLSKRTTKSDRNKESNSKYENSDSQEQSETYINEIIKISTGDRRHKNSQQYSKRQYRICHEKDFPRNEFRRKRQEQNSSIKQSRYKLDSKESKVFEGVVTVSDESEEDKVECVEASAKKDNASDASQNSAELEKRSPYFDRISSVSSRNRSRSRSKSCDSNRSDDDNIVNAEDITSSENTTSPIDMQLPPYYPAIQGCRSVEEFQCLNRIEEGTYGVVYRARDKRSEEIVALKRLKMEKEKEGFPITSLREINTLLKGQHPNIVTVREIVVGSNMDKIFIVMDYVEHDLKSLMETMRHKKQNFLPAEIKCLLSQLLLAVSHLHDNWILHRDLKTSNLLLSHKGILKVGDFGLAREYGSPLKAYTPIVVTLWYRAPELLLCTKQYSTPIDLWSVGCIFAELLLMNALFPGKSEVDQLNRVFKDLGTPTEKIWPGFSQLPAVKKIKLNDYPTSDLKSKFSTLTDLGLGLLLKFLTYDPVQRITAEEALTHDYFKEAPLPIDPAMFPTWPAKSELGQKRAMAASPKPPSGGGEYKRLKGDDDNFGFRLSIGGEVNSSSTGFNLKF